MESRLCSGAHACTGCWRRGAWAGGTCWAGPHLWRDSGVATPACNTSHVTNTSRRLLPSHCNAYEGTGFCSTCRVLHWNSIQIWTLDPAPSVVIACHKRPYSSPASGKLCSHLGRPVIHSRYRVGIALVSYCHIMVHHITALGMWQCWR